MLRLVLLESSNRDNALTCTYDIQAYTNKIIVVTMTRRTLTVASRKCFAQFFKATRLLTCTCSPCRHHRQRKGRITAVEDSGGSWARKYTLSSTLVGGSSRAGWERKTRRYFSLADRRRAHTRVPASSVIFLQSAYTYMCMYIHTREYTPRVSCRWWTQGRNAERETEREGEREGGRKGEKERTKKRERRRSAG